VELFEGNDIAITPGVTDTQSNEKIISVLNFGNEDVTIYPNMRLGTCESFYETDQNNFERCAQIVLMQKIHSLVYKINFQNT